MSPVAAFENINVKLMTVLAAAGASVVVIVAGTMAWSNLNNKLDVINKTLEDSYTLSRASEVALREAIENPGLRKVDPRDPSKIISVVKSGTTNPNPEGR